MNRRTFTAAAGGVVAGSLAGCLSNIREVGGARRERRRTFPVAEGMDLRLRNKNGPVTVDAFSGEQLEADIIVRGPTTGAVDAISISDELRDDTLSLETEYGIDDAESSVEIAIRYPRTMRIGQVETTNASVHVDIARMTAETTIRTTNGSLEAALDPSLGTRVRASTTNASIRVGRVDLVDVRRGESELVGTLGDGTKTLMLETANASIQIQSLSR